MNRRSYVGKNNPKYGQNKYGLIKERLKQLYEKENLSLNLIAKKFKCNYGIVQWYFRKFNIPTKNISERGKLRHNRPETKFKGLQGINNPNYKHGKYTSESIYRKLIKNSQCELCGNNQGQIDRHHKDENHFNNKINNLMVLCSKCHSRIHKLAYWSKRK